MNLTDKQIYDLNNMNVAAQNVALGNMLDEMVFIDSPEFTGTPTAPTAEAGTDDNQIATTAFVQNAISSGGIAYVLIDYISGMTETELAVAVNTQIEAGNMVIIKYGEDMYQLLRKSLGELGSREYYFGVIAPYINGDIKSFSFNYLKFYRDIEGEWTVIDDYGYITVTPEE